jgi:hypothetical protein
MSLVRIALKSPHVHRDRDADRPGHAGVRDGAAAVIIASR